MYGTSRHRCAVAKQAQARPTQIRAIVSCLVFFGGICAGHTGGIEFCGSDMEHVIRLHNRQGFGMEKVLRKAEGMHAERQTGFPVATVLRER